MSDLCPALDIPSFPQNFQVRLPWHRRRPDHRRPLPRGVPRETRASRRTGRPKCLGPTCTRLPRAAEAGSVPAVRKIRLDPIGNSGPGRPSHRNSLRVVDAPKPRRRTGTGTRTTSDGMGPRRSANPGPARIAVATILLDPSGLTIPALSLNRCTPTLKGLAFPYAGYRRRLHRLPGRHKMPVPRAGEHGAVSRGAAARLLRPVRRLFRNACTGPRPARMPRSRASQ